MIGTGENSEFGEIFKLMKAEEVTESIKICCFVYKRLQDNQAPAEQ